MESNKSVGIESSQSGGGGVGIILLSWVGYALAGLYYVFQTYGLLYAVLGLPLISIGAGIAGLLTGIAFLLVVVVLAIAAILPFLPVIGLVALAKD